MKTETGSAAGRQDNGTSLNKILDIACFNRFQQDAPRSRRDYQPNRRSRFLPFYNIGCYCQVLQAAVSTGADNYLLYLDSLKRPDRDGIIYGVGTYGTPDNSITFGLGFGYSDEDISDKPALILGGEYRIIRRMSLVSENWVFPEVDEPLISYGIRFFGESLSADFALFNILDEDAFFPGFPMISFTWNF